MVSEINRSAIGSRTARNGKLDIVPIDDAPISGAGPPHLVAVADIAGLLGVVVTKVHQLVRERSLIAVRTHGALRIPEEFIDPEATNGIVKGLSGTITLLTDAGYTDAEILQWLFAEDDSLPGRPITALRENRGREVHRRAQAAGF